MDIDLSFWMRSVSKNSSLELLIHDGSSYFVDQVLTTTPTWTQYNVTLTATRNVTTPVYYLVYKNNTTANDHEAENYIDDLVITPVN